METAKSVASTRIDSEHRLPSSARPAKELRFDLLGPVHVRVDGAVRDVGSPQAQAFLAVLLLQPGRTATLAELVHGIWGDEPPDTAVAAVRTHAWKWRRFLETSGVGRDALVSRGDGYRLTLTGPLTDVEEVEGLSTSAAEARTRGCLEEADTLLKVALGRWYGEPLNRVPGDFAARQRARLTELSTALSEERCDIRLALGRASFAVPDLMVLTAAHPLRQRAHRLLMQALRDTGRQHEALAVFDRIRRALAEEHGIDPEPELVRMHQRILAGEGLAEAPSRGTTTKPAPWPPQALPSWPVPHQLPHAVEDFVGNEQAFSWVTETLLQLRRTGPAIVTVTGVPGSGKSSLAVRAAHQVQRAFPDGVLHADLMDEGKRVAPSSVLHGFLVSLGLPRAALPDGLSDLSALFRSMTDGRRLLIVLDDAHDAAQVRPLLPGSPQCAVLVAGTRLFPGLPVTRRVRLRPVSVEESLDILASVMGHERLREERAAASELVEVCERLPLVVHAVGDWLAIHPDLSLETLVRQIHDDPGYLLSHCETVRACFEKNFRQLDPGLAWAWTRLSWSTGCLTAASAARTLGVPHAGAEMLLERLADASMLERQAHRGYVFSALLRQFAHHKYPLPQTVPHPPLVA
ncbi:MULTISPECIES: AfsR/SARP family transcriptional regulator [unclassified Streptomyces]|uniref:AfsR/SARP family transcriptional regulator n=1 Tax=unclassified Streptomyces TaxID=2593676 RepID=UPI00068AB975|nr:MULTISPECIES: BTAD domain-containing putative transcriptional regulator [unclassified Streptomyces]